MLDNLLKTNMKVGNLEVDFGNGMRSSYGQGLAKASVHFHDKRAPAAIARDPQFALGQTYMDGRWSTDNLPALITLLTQNFNHIKPTRLGPFGHLSRYFQQLNRRVTSYRNVHHHYDLDEWLFRRFLDKDLHYSCAYFKEPGIDLEGAQRAKCRHIMHKLALTPGQQVLDIGCGWGGLALFLAEHAGVHVTGLTLSQEQWRVAQQQAHMRGLSQRVNFLREDYREHTGQYDRIVSVGMFEHVGVPYYVTFFNKINVLLKPKGVTLLHTIGRSGAPGKTNPWIQKYIFPGGYNPALSEVLLALHKTNLIPTDIEVLRLHYSLTLAEWQRRFQRHRAEVVTKLSERFARMWEFYLAACEAAFAAGELVVYQLQLSNDVGALPLTRDYLYQAKARSPVASNLFDAHIQPSSLGNSNHG